ncbi:MAG: aa3-type cytochrome c oxidase subunit IV [Bradyrhizobiaceae bacterium]|nr:aa3-type cytochrome c oxidase subunit IV [Bradyrhizobiaceae bacterium]
MSDHGEVQYATAAGNDMPAHEAGYQMFLQGTFVLTAAVVNILLGLAVGGVLGHWPPAAALIVCGVIAAAITAWTGSRTVSLVMIAISGLTLLFNAYT